MSKRKPKQRRELAEERTSRCIVLDEGYRRFGATAELGSVIAEKAFYHLDAPVRRIAAMDIPVPFAPTLEDQTIPNVEGLVGVAREILGR